MPDGMRKFGVGVLVVALMAWAHGPALSAGAFGGDLELLAGLKGRGPLVLFGVPGTGGRPLAGLSLFIDRGLWNPDKVWTTAEIALVRLGNLALLVAIAAGLRVAVRRAVEPFLGSESAHAAASTAAVFLLVHPLAVSAVGHLSARGDLLGLALGTWSAALFLIGRQDKFKRRLTQAFVLAGVASLASRWALVMPFVLGGIEFLSAGRHRHVGLRTHTTITTFVIAAALVSVEGIARHRWAPEPVQHFIVFDAGAFHPALFLRELGTVLLPVDLAGMGVIGYVFAAIALGLALHPGFVAGRTAPRLWGRLLVGWAISLFVTHALHDGGRVSPGELAAAPGLIGAAIVLSIGFGLGSTAFSGSRRVVLPALTALFLAILGRGVSMPISLAGHAVQGLQRALAVQELDPEADQLVIVDFPREVAGVATLGGNLDSLLSDRLLSPTTEGPSSKPRMRLTDQQGLRMWVTTSEFDPATVTLMQWSKQALAILAVPEALGGGEDPGNLWTVGEDWVYSMDPMPPPTGIELQFWILDLDTLQRRSVEVERSEDGLVARGSWDLWSEMAAGRENRLAWALVMLRDGEATMAVTSGRE